MRKKEHESEAAMTKDANAVVAEYVGENDPALHTSTNELANTAAQPYPLANLFESPLNPRKVVSDAGLEAMAEDMRLHGFRAWSPIFARPMSEGGAEIAKGHRRSRAARLAGLTHVPVVLVEMSDAQFLEILNFDNDGGEAVHPLHVAEGWKAYMAATGETVKEIATRASLSIEAVYKRLKCLELSDEGKALFLSGRIKEGHAALIARLTEDLQAQAVWRCTAPNWDPEREPPTVVELAEWIDEQKKLTEARTAQDTLPLEPATAVPVEPLHFATIDEGGSEVKADAITNDSAPEWNDADYANAEDEDGDDDDEDGDDNDDEADEADEAEYSRAAPPPAASSSKMRDRAEEARLQAERDRHDRDRRDEEAKRVARETEVVDKTYDKAVDAILAKITWPMSAADFLVIFEWLIGSFDGAGGWLADKFAIPGSVGRPRWRDLQLAGPKMPPVKLLRIAIAGILVELGDSEGRYNNPALLAFAKRYKINVTKLQAAVESEIYVRLGLRAQNPPADPRKAAISKLPSLGEKARQKIADAQKPRWAEHKKQEAAKKAAPKPSKKSGPAKKATKGKGQK